MSMRNLQSGRPEYHSQMGPGSNLTQRGQAQSSTCALPSWSLTSTAPVARTPTLVRNREHSYLVVNYSVDQRVMKAPHQKASLTVTPNPAQAWVLEQKAYRILEFL